jgi:hypothetical protein
VCLFAFINACMRCRVSESVAWIASASFSCIATCKVSAPECTTIERILDIVLA